MVTSGACDAIVYTKHGVLIVRWATLPIHDKLSQLGLRVLASGHRRGNLYYMLPKKIPVKARAVMPSTRIDNRAGIWHCRLGHIPYSARVAMRNSGRYPAIVFTTAELHATTLALCKACVFGKLRKKALQAPGKR